MGYIWNPSRHTRLVLYKEALIAMEKIPVRSIDDTSPTWQHSVAFCKILVNLDNYTHIEDLSELMAYEPRQKWPEGDAYWFHPYDRIRIKILKKIILKMEHPIIWWFINLFKK